MTGRMARHIAIGECLREMSAQGDDLERIILRLRDAPECVHPILFTP